MEKQTAVEDLTLMMLYLTSFTETNGGLSQQKAWKGYDFDALDQLADSDFLYGSHQAKSITLTQEGIQRAEELLAHYRIEIDEPGPAASSFRFVLHFNFDELFCSRTLLVPKHTSFEDFHTMIQACLNWMNYHLYDFELVSSNELLHITYPDYETGGDPRASFRMPDDKDVWKDSTKVYLDDYFPKTRKARYSYDYGDCWEIEIEMTNQGERIEAGCPVCWDGNGDAPPEDAGGEGGFIRFLEAIEDEDDPEHDHLAAWGESQGFEYFNLRKTNKRLRHWTEWTRRDA